jgi:hypothetical protein
LTPNDIFWTDYLACSALLSCAHPLLLARFNLSSSPVILEIQSSKPVQFVKAVWYTAALQRHKEAR